jgi:hypothetical protein
MTGGQPTQRVARRDHLVQGSALLIAAGADPLEHADDRGRAALLEVGQDEDVTGLMVAAEAPVGERPDIVLKEPKADLGVAVVGKSIGAEIDDQISVLLVGGSIGVGDVVLVGDRAGLVFPLRDVLNVLAPTSESRLIRSRVFDDSGAAGDPALLLTLSQSSLASLWRRFSSLTASPSSASAPA